MHRRQILKAAALWAPVASAARVDAPPPLPGAALPAEKYWARIRAEQFLMPQWRIFMNNGSLGVTPRPVVKAVTDFLEYSARLEMGETEYPRWGYETLEKHREEVAAYVGCNKDDLAFTHNATEALSTIAAGIDLRSGDEVIMTDQEHGSGKAGWQVRQARHGVTVREVALPIPPKNPEELTDRLITAIGPRTRVLFFSAITTATGLVMPTRQICDAARAKGVITVVDGAHLNGQIRARVDELGCDYYAGSPHKWMFAPAGCGILWGRPEMLDRLWPSIVTGGWDDRGRKAARFMAVGTNNRSIFEGMLAGVRFANAIGAERIFDRIHQLARQVRAKAAALGYVDILTPDDDRMYGSLVTINTAKLNLDKFWELTQKRRIWTIRGPKLRVSTHIHTRPEDIDALFDVIRLARA